MWVGVMKILKLLMIIRIFSNNSLSGLDEQDNGFKNRVFLRHLPVTVGERFYLMKLIRTKSENGAND